MKKRRSNGNGTSNKKQSKQSKTPQKTKMNTNNTIKESSTTSSSDTFNYALLLLLYTIQGIPLGLSASIPFLIQQKFKNTSSSYSSQAIFAFATWPFSLKLLWAPIVDAVYIKRIGRRKSWLFPTQFIAGCILLFGSDYIENQLGSSKENEDSSKEFHVQGITIYFFALYFLMATQDIAVDGWALTMLSKKNRGKGPICNSIGQNIGYFLSFVGFLALNDVDSSENIWRPLFGFDSLPGVPLVSLGSFMKFMGFFILFVTVLVGIFKTEVEGSKEPSSIENNKKDDQDDDDDDDEPAELDASEIGIIETYQRLWAVCSLPAVRSLFLILLTYRLPTALSDNVKFLKAVEYGLSKQTTALLSPAIMLPLAIAVPIVAAKLWHGHPLTQFLTAYKLRVTLVPLFDVMMLLSIRSLRGSNHHSVALERYFFWLSIIMSTALQAIMNSLQFNAQMTFFASRVDPAIGGSYMTLLNTAANLGGTWPASVVMYLVGRVTTPPICTISNSGVELCTEGKDGYFPLQLILSLLGLLWIFLLSNKVLHIAQLPEASWRTKYFKTWNMSQHPLTASVRTFFKSISFMERGETTNTQRND